MGCKGVFITRTCYHDVSTSCTRSNIHFLLLFVDTNKATINTSNHRKNDHKNGRLPWPPGDNCITKMLPITAVSIFAIFPTSGMAVFRKISSPKSWLICIVVLFVVLVLSLLIKFHSVVNSCLVPESTYFYRNQIPDRGKGQGRNISSQSMSSHLKIVSNAAPLYTDDNVTAAKFWERIDSMITNDNLYSEDFNVSMVVNVLRHAKLVKADLFLVRNSYKWILYIQGGQRVVFKPWLV